MRASDAITLAYAPIAVMHDGFSTASLLEEILRVLNCLTLGGVLRIRRVCSGLNYLPPAIRAWDDMRLVRPTHGDSIPSYSNSKRRRNTFATSPANRR